MRPVPCGPTVYRTSRLRWYEAHANAEPNGIGRNNPTLVYVQNGGRALNNAGCVPAVGYSKRDTSTVYMRRAKVRVSYKFSDGEASAKYKYKWSGGTTNGEVTLSEM